MHFVYNEEVIIAASNYKWSINWILIIQTMGVGLGTVAPVSRWFLAAKLKSSNNIREFFEELFLPDCFGLVTPITWAETPLSLKIQDPNFRNFIKLAKNIIILFYLINQNVIFLASKLLLRISAVCVKVILLCFPQDDSSEEIDEFCTNLLDDLGVATNRVESLSNEVDKLIKMGRKKQPKDLNKLLNKCVDFKGVKEFVNQPMLRPDDSSNCWSLSIVILTSIAVQLPNITTDKIEELLGDVKEGLRFVNLIEKSLNVKLERYRFRHGAEDLWSQVLLYRCCDGINVKRQSYEETLEALAEKAPDIAAYDRFGGIGPESDPFTWSFQKMAARSTEYICATIIVSNKDNDGETEADLFERISIMISDLLSACLTNLPTLITSKCTSSPIKERENNVRKAAILLGETKVILETLQKRKLPGLDPEKAAHLNEWRILLEQNPN